MTLKKVAKASVPRTNLDRVRKIAESWGGESDWWSPKEGKSTIRILPSNQEDGSFFYRSVLHYGFVIDGQKRAYPCFLATGESKCPVCQVIGAHQDDTNPDVKVAIRQLLPKKRFIMNILDRSDETGSVKLFGAGPQIMKQILAFFRDVDYGDITDPEEGLDIKISREGKGLDTEYTVLPATKQSPIGVKGWSKNLHDLQESAYREVPSREKYIQYLMDQFGDLLDIRLLFKSEMGKKSVVAEDEDDDEEEEEEAPVKKAPVKVKRKTLVKVEEEEDEEELSDDDDEEEDDD